MRHSTVLVIGATGYVGSRLTPLLLNAGWPVRIMVRSRKKLIGRSWASHPLLDIKTGDVRDRSAFAAAAAGCDRAIYLVHSMTAAGKDFALADRTGAQNMAAAGAEAGMERIIYLGGLIDPAEPHMSEHMRSRIETGAILMNGSVPATELRAAAILGAGSASFEMLRFAVERFPVMLAPPEVHTLSQPIAIRDVLAYLSACLEHPHTPGKEIDIGGLDRLSYADMTRIYAEEAGIRPPLMITAPFVRPKTAGFLLHRFSPLPAAIVRPLIEGLKNEAVCRNQSARDMIPLDIMSCREALRHALKGDQD